MPKCIKRGQVVQLKHKGMKFDVRVLEQKNSFGRERYLVKPVHGTGVATIEL